jgi:hypothetical protein
LLADSPVAAIRKGGGRPAPSDTVPARLTPGETVIDKGLSEEALAPLVAIFQKKGHVTQADVEKYLYPILANLEAGEGTEKGFAEGGLVDSIRQFIQGPKDSGRRVPRYGPQGLLTDSNGERRQTVTPELPSIRETIEAIKTYPKRLDDAIEKDSGYAAGGEVIEKSKDLASPQNALSLLGSLPGRIPSAVGWGLYSRPAGANSDVTPESLEWRQSHPLPSDNKKPAGYAAGGKVLGYADSGRVVDPDEDKKKVLNDLGKQYENDPYLGLRGVIPWLTQQPSGMRLPAADAVATLPATTTIPSQAKANQQAATAADLTAPSPRIVPRYGPNGLVTAAGAGAGAGNLLAGPEADKPLRDLMPASTAGQSATQPQPAQAKTSPAAGQSATQPQPAQAKTSPAAGPSAKQPQPAQAKTSPAAGPSYLDINAAQMGPQALLAGTASGVQYRQAPDGTVTRADGKPMGGSFNVTGSVQETDPATGQPTGRKVVASPIGQGSFVYDKDGKLVDYFSPMTQEADRRAQQAGYADRRDYLAQMQQGAVRQPGYGAAALLAGPQPSQAELDNQRRFGLDRTIQNLQDRLWMNNKRSTAHALGELLNAQTYQQNAQGNQALAAQRLMGEQYGKEMAADVGHERNAIDAEGNRIKGAELLLGRKGSGKEKMDEMQASMLQQLASETDPAKQQSAMKKYQALFGGKEPADKWMEMKMPDPTLPVDAVGQMQTRSVAFNPATGETRIPQAADNAESGKPPPKVGEIVRGHRYKGGDPTKPESWEKVQ